MSWLYSQALVAEYSEARCSVGALCALSSGTPTPHAFLHKDRMTDFSRPSRFGMTFGHLTDELGGEVLMWFLEASRARTSALQARETALMGRGQASGQKWRGSLARYSHDLRSWRTAQHSLLGGSDEYSETWPRWGTTVAGELYLLPMLVRPIDGSGSGLWQTPVADDAVTRKQGKWNSRGEPKLSAQVLLAPLKLWPTPTVCGNYNRKGASATSGDGLATAVRMWPTPNASDNRDRGNLSDPAVQRRIKKGKQIGLSMVVKDGPMGGSLNPTWVEWLMGWPLGWTDLQPLATAKSHMLQPLHGAA